MLTAVEQARAEHAGLDVLTAAALCRYRDAQDSEDEAYRAYKAARDATNGAWDDYTKTAQRRTAAHEQLLAALRAEAPAPPQAAA